MGKHIRLSIAILCLFICVSPVYAMPQYNIIELVAPVNPDGSTGAMPRDINNSGQVVCAYDGGEPGREYGFLYSGGAMTFIGGFQPTAINENGQVVGFGSGPSERISAVLYSGGHNRPSISQSC